MSGVDGNQSQNGPPLELMHLAAAGNTVVGDKYGLFFKNVFFFLVSSEKRGGEGGAVGGGSGEDESCSNASVRWCLVCPPTHPPLPKLNPLHCQHGGSQCQRGSAFGPAAACQFALF